MNNLIGNYTKLLIYKSLVVEFSILVLPRIYLLTLMDRDFQVDNNIIIQDKLETIYSIQNTPKYKPPTWIIFV